MLITIGDYSLADGTLAGGRSLTGLRLQIQRIFDVVVALGEVSPVLYDRNKRKADITFSVQRVQDSIKDAEDFCLIHEATVPRTGDVKLITTASIDNASSALVVNGELLSHELVRQIGSFTEHSYHIIGSLLFAPDVGARMLMETGDFMLIETGDKMLLE